ncbi:hypothetical protein Metok_0474 [Methanothermococcus okinawensis IH1]|uniref:DUF3784 domain-containing protein n=1 Tax=Methanothermococcus okinawensis (strain DSM 14208 / JCM 11175 / IH1) TaxID=647113 RepID=F8AL60_METOI|nr:hypothetical protein Metok_0474 [Methanothermococcus okinawensis IH1]
MDSWIIITIFITIYALIVPWFVNWVILNRNKKVSFLKSLHYLEENFNTKEKISVEFVMFILVIILMYGYMLLTNINQLYKIFYLFFGILIGFLVNYMVKIQLFEKNLNKL